MIEYITDIFIWAVALLSALVLMAHFKPANSIIATCRQWQTLLAAIAALGGVAYASVEQSSQAKVLKAEQITVKNCNHVHGLDHKVDLDAYYFGRFQNIVKEDEYQKRLSGEELCKTYLRNINIIAKVMPDYHIDFDEIGYLNREVLNISESVSIYTSHFKYFSDPLVLDNCAAGKTDEMYRKEAKIISKFIADAVEQNTRVRKDVDALLAKCGM